MDPSAALLPAGQDEQVFAFSTSDEVAPARAYVPTGQVTGPEHNGEPRPVFEPKVPAGQAVQPLAVPGNEYVPAKQVFAQFTPHVPAGQGETTVPAELQINPAGRFTQEMGGRTRPRNSRAGAVMI